MKHKIEMNDEGKAMLAILIGRQVTEALPGAVALACMINDREGKVWGQKVSIGMATITHPIYAKIAHAASGYIIDILRGGGLSPDKDDGVDEEGAQHIKADDVESVAIAVISTMLTQYIRQVDEAVASLPPADWDKDKYMASVQGGDEVASEAKKRMQEAIKKVDALMEKDEQEEKKKGDGPADADDFRRSFDKIK